MGFDDVAKRWELESVTRRVDQLERARYEVSSEAGNADMKATMALVFLGYAVVLGLLFMWDVSDRLPADEEHDRPAAELEVEAGPGR